MAMTRIQLVTEICDIVGKKATAAAVSGAVLKDRVVNYLNWGQERIARCYSFVELMAPVATPSTVISQKDYDITSDLALTRFKDVHGIVLYDVENSRRLDRWSYLKFDKYYPRPENFATGRPNLYVRWGNKITLFRIPDAVYSLKIRYSMWAQDLVGDSQVSDFIFKDALLVAAGVLETYLALEEYQDAAVWQAKFGVQSPTTGAWSGLLGDAIKQDDADIDWAPDAEPSGSKPKYSSGTPSVDPYADPADPLFGYPE